MAQETAHDWPNEKLVQYFMDACGRASISNSGFVIDFMAGSNFEEAHYIKGVILSRLDGKKQPFKRDDVVVIKANIRIVGSKYRGPDLGHDKNFTVWRVHYDNGKWFLEFNGIRGERGTAMYDAEKFELDELAKSEVIA
jgi:hypothetical protein